MKNTIFILLLSFVFMGYSQDACEMKTQSLIDLIEKNNKELPSDGAKYVFIADCKYLVGIGTSSTGSKTVSTMSRVAAVKARREVSNLINGTNVSSNTIITTEEIITDDMVSYAEAFRDEIKESSAAFVQGMAELTKFKSSDGTTFVYVLFKAVI